MESRSSRHGKRRSRSRDRDRKDRRDRDASRERSRSRDRDRDRDRDRTRDKSRSRSRRRSRDRNGKARERSSDRGHGASERRTTNAEVRGSQGSDMRSLVANLSLGASQATAGGGGPGGRRQLDKFLDELRTKHIQPTDSLSQRVRQVQVRVPEGPKRHVIDAVARAVSKHGEELEEAVRADVSRHGAEILKNLLGINGEDGVDFTFLVKGAESQEAHYYRWRTFSFAQGDKGHRWRTEPFQMCPNGTIWHPPACDGGQEEDEDDSGSASRSRSRGRRRRAGENRRKELGRTKGQTPGTAKLDKRERRDFAHLLQELVPKAVVIANAMCWCLDRADCAMELAQRLEEGLLEQGLELPERVLRLFLLSDVVHNAGSSVASVAWCFRKEFEQRLPAVFEGLHAAYRDESSTLVAEKCKSGVLGVLRSWADRTVFTPIYVKGLEASFLRSLQPAELLHSGSCEGGTPDSIFARLREWRAQHFSQLEKIARSRGLNWQTSHIEKPTDGRSAEDLKQTWLVDRLVNYELHAWETRPAPAPAPEPIKVPRKLRGRVSGKSGEHVLVLGENHVPRSGLSRNGGHTAYRDDPELDGDSLSSGDEAYMADEAKVQNAPLARGLRPAQRLVFNKGLGSKGILERECNPVD